MEQCSIESMQNYSLNQKNINIKFPLFFGIGLFFVPQRKIRDAILHLNSWVLTFECHTHHWNSAVKTMKNEPDPNWHCPKCKTSKLVNDNVRCPRPTTIIRIIYSQHVEGPRSNEKMPNPLSLPCCKAASQEILKIRDVSSLLLHHKQLFTPK